MPDFYPLEKKRTSWLQRNWVWFGPLWFWIAGFTIGVSIINLAWVLATR